MASDEGTLDSVQMKIDGTADSLVDQLKNASDNGGLRTAEVESLRAIDKAMAESVTLFDRLIAPASRDAEGRLLLIDCYQEVLNPAETHSGTPAIEGTVTRDEQEQWRRLIKALLAAEVEITGKFKLRRADSTRLARMLERIGVEFRATGLPLHAAYAFERAVGLYSLLGDNRATDNCLLAGTRARNAARDPGLHRVLGATADALIGYGYLPFRLLWWALAQLVFFSCLLWLVTPPDIDVIRAAYLSLFDFLNPLGFGDISALKGPGTSLLVVETYSGTISMSVFFALLVRRWFIA
jgi:hypothetical protein